MANKEISELTPGDALDGTELFHGVQGGNSRKFTSTQVVASVALMSGVPVNLGISASVALNALTVAIKGADGNDPSASNPVYVPFRSSTASDGSMSVLAITAATSLVISSGSTMGFTSALPGRLWIVGFNDAGTFRLGLVNCLSGTNVMPLRPGIYSSTDEGGAGGADSAQVIYSASAVSAKAMTILGYIEATEATAGTWATAPAIVKVHQAGDALPGSEVQIRSFETGTVASSANTFPLDGTIPQISEGAEFMSLAITPLSAANLLSVETQACVSTGGSSAFLTNALFRDATADALAVSLDFETTATGARVLQISHVLKAGSVSSTTFRTRLGGNSGVTTMNGIGGVQYYGGKMNSYMRMREIMA